MKIHYNPTFDCYETTEQHNAEEIVLDGIALGRANMKVGIWKFVIEDEAEESQYQKWEVRCPFCNVRVIGCGNRGISENEAREYLEDTLIKHKYCHSCGARLRVRR